MESLTSRTSWRELVSERRWGGTGSILDLGGPLVWQSQRESIGAIGAMETIPDRGPRADLLPQVVQCVHDRVLVDAAEVGGGGAVDRSPRSG